MNFFKKLLQEITGKPRRIFAQVDGKVMEMQNDNLEHGQKITVKRGTILKHIATQSLHVVIHVGDEDKGVDLLCIKEPSTDFKVFNTSNKLTKLSVGDYGHAKDVGEIILSYLVILEIQ